MKSGPDVLIDEIDRHVDDTLMRSGALQPETALPVSLKTLAAHLDARINFYNDRRTPKFGKTRLRGTLHFRAGAWSISVGAPELPATRLSAAHELAHLLLFSFDRDRMLSLWESSYWTIYEEAVANYVARRILVPPVVAPIPAPTTNLAEFVVGQLQGRFGIPQETAALRWLDDECEIAQETFAILIGAQYNLWNTAFLRRAAYRDAKTVVALIELAAVMKARCSDHSWQMSVESWRWVFDCEKDRKKDLFWKNALRRDLKLLLTVRERIKELPYEWRSSVIGTLTGADIRKTFHYRSLYWRQRPKVPCFVALKKGSLKAGSQAATLAATTNAEKNRERFDTLSIVGDFNCHGFAHGAAVQGMRYIIQVLQGI